MSDLLRLDVVSDTICPWCYIGKRRLAGALAMLGAEGLAFAVTWRPFQLNPTMPKEGVARREYRTQKFGSWERSQQLDAQVAEAGRSEGLAFRHDLMERTPNTLASHALIRLALEAGGDSLQDRVVEDLFVAYFTQGQDIGNLEILAGVGEQAGLDSAQVRAALSDEGVLAAVADEESRIRASGLDGVPGFFVEGHFVFAGAHPAPAMARALREVSATFEKRRAAASG